MQIIFLAKSAEVERRSTKMQIESKRNSLIGKLNEKVVEN